MYLRVSYLMSVQFKMWIEETHFQELFTSFYPCDDEKYASTDDFSFGLLYIQRCRADSPFPQQTLIFTK